MDEPCLGKSQLGVQTFLASVHRNDQCGSDGLPLTPNSIKILGRFQKLKSFTCRFLCKYVNIVRGKHERLMVVMERMPADLGTESAAANYSKHFPDLAHLMYAVLHGLECLHNKDVIHRNLSPQSILLDGNIVKLSNYGLYYMTDSGRDVDFPIGSPRYMAPEVLQLEMNGTAQQHQCSFKCDIWSFGVIILEILLGVNLWKDLSLEEMHKKTLDLAKSKCVVEQIARDHGADEKLEDLPNVLKHILSHCLSPSPSKRSSATDLLKLPLFNIERASQARCKNGLSPFSGKLRSEHLELNAFDSQNGICTNGEVDYISERGIDEVYYLWSLAGGDLENELNKKGMIKKKPPVFTLPNLVLCDGEGFGREAHRTSAFDETVVILSLDTLHERLKGLDPKIYYPLIEDQTQSFPSSVSMSDLSSTTGLPLIIREQDIEYQLHRTILFKRLIDGFPYKRAQIWKEARVDIPPLVRPYIWAALLDVEIDNINAYEQIDKQVPMVTDRQIEVDIPRCHQYNQLLSSPEAHKKFKRILKAWVISHPHYVYWQGLDSLCAVFLYLNFNNEALAYTCLTAFINKYLHKFFLRDNSPVIQEYLAVFSHMIALHDPELTNHLDSIGFIPELYSIPWFLTMYTHVFPLHKIFHLWDTLLLGDSSLPLFIGVAILKQLRDSLLSFGFNECILLFSDMPDIDIAKCVQDSISYFRSTPKSATFRTHAKARTAKKDNGKTELKMEAIPLSMLKSERSPRISAEDLLELCALSPTASQTYNIQRGQAHTKVLLVDVRNTEDYMRGTVPGAINIQFSTAFTADGDLVASPAVSTLYAHYGKVIVVIGNRGSNASNFADVLVKLGFPKVCLLHKGIDILRSTGVLCVPTPEI